MGKNILLKNNNLIFIGKEEIYVIFLFLKEGRVILLEDKGIFLGVNKEGIILLYEVIKYLLYW